MKAALWSFVVSSFCSLLAADIPVDPTFDVTKVAGKWYPLITANYNYPYSKRPYYAFTVAPLSNGGLDLKDEIPRDGACKVKRFLLQALRPGVFRSEDGKLTVHILKTDNNHYLISRSEIGDQILLQLVVKGKDSQSEWSNHFFTLAQDLEFSPAKFSYLRESDLCTTPPEQA